MARVLVVDDDLAVLEVTVGCLVAMGHQVQAARDGAEAREVLAQGDVDVTDLQMPVVNGLELLAYVRALPHPVPVVMISGAWTAADRARASAFGAARLRDKPVDLAHLARDVEELAQ